MIASVAVLPAPPLPSVPSAAKYSSNADAFISSVSTSAGNCKTINKAIGVNKGEIYFNLCSTRRNITVSKGEEGERDKKKKSLGGRHILGSYFSTTFVITKGALMMHTRVQAGPVMQVYVHHYNAVHEYIFYKGMGEGVATKRRGRETRPRRKYPKLCYVGCTK